MLNLRDKNLLLRIIKTGDYSIILQLNINLDRYDPSKIINILHNDERKRMNYSLAKKLSDIIYPKKDKIKINLINLLAFELNYYSDQYQHNQAYNKINAFLTTLVAFPIQKRLKKFLMRYCQVSKTIQAIVSDKSDQLEILKLLRNLTLETRNVISESII